MSSASVIYSIMRRGTLIILAALLSVNVAMGQGWNGVAKAPSLTGSGTEEDPYIIKTADDLKFLQDSPILWEAGVHILQTDDIDLNNHVLGMIGWGKQQSAITSDANNAGHKAFKAIYDGGGHKISNLKVDWSEATTTRGAFGLFGLVTGTVRNLQIDNATVTRESNGNVSIDGLKVSVLCGAAAPGAVIENIIITNSSINDGGNNPAIYAAYVGSIVGDITCGYFGTYPITQARGYVTIRNVYADVDINITAAGKPSSVFQYNVGGIVGRMRRGKYADLPDNTFYTGTIRAPWATIGPVFGSSRADANSGVADIFKMYVGQVLRDENTTLTGPNDGITMDVETQLNDGTTVHPDETRFYDRFYIYDSNTGTDVDASTLAEVTSTAGGVTRTVRTLATGSLPPSLGTQAAVRSFQGVNRGRQATSITDVVDMFNQYVRNHEGLNTWMAVGDRPVFTNRHYLLVDQTGRHTFHADLQPDDIGFAYKWYGHRAKQGDWVELKDSDPNVSGATTHTLTCTNPNLYSEIRAVVTKDDVTLRAATLVRHPSLDLTYDRATGSYKAIAGNLFDGEQYEYHWSYYDSVTGAWVNNDQMHTVGTTGTTSNDTYPHPATAWMVAVELHYNGQPITDVDGNHLRQTFTNYRLELTRVTTHSEDKAGFRYVASVYSPDGRLVRGGDENIQGPNTTWLWEVTSDPSNRLSWEGTDLWDRGLQKQNYIAPYSPDRYYRVTWMVGGEPVLEQVMGPVNVIFLYDKEKTSVGFNMGYTTFDGYDNTNGLQFDDGDDNNTGYGPYHAVKTMKRAYELVDPSRGVNGNIIVVMGYYYDDDFLHTPGDYAKPATITGNRGSLIYDGGLNMVTTDGDYSMGLQAATTFRLINFVGDSSLNGYLTASGLTSNMVFIYCNLNDLTIDEGVVMRNYALYGGVNGLYMKDGKNANAPNVTIVGGIHNRNVTTDLVYPPYNVTEGVTTITLNSGCYGRVIAGARNNTLNPTSHNVFGSPEHPHRVRVNVAISHAEGQDQTEYADHDYDFDINLLVGGQTDGTVYSEAEINVSDGSIGRFISGNISYGRSVGADHPDDSYFGSTMLTLHGGSIDELYGGTLGRHSGNSAGSSPYFYGRSIINIDGGTVNSHIYGAGAGGVMGIGDCEHGMEEGQEYDMHHTSDGFIPYYDAAHNLKYGDFATVYAGSAKDADGVPLFDNVPTMDLVLSATSTASRAADDTRLHLGHSYSEVNIWSGTVNGNVYGGGYGYASEVPVEKALDQAGYVFGETYVNMEARRAVPPTVNGNIYGGGHGSDIYYHQYIDYLLLVDKNNYAELHNKAALDAYYQTAFDNYRAGGKTVAQATTLAQKDRDTKRDEWLAANYTAEMEQAKRVSLAPLARNKFGKVARLFGNTHVTLKGGYVDGNVFGGSVGDVALSDMATIYGNSHLLMDGATVNGHIYGGSDYASIRFVDHQPDAASSGNTHVTVRSGVVGNCVFGGSRGSDGTAGLPESFTDIDGDTHVNIEGGDFMPTPYINKRDKTDGYRTFNIYGGGSLKCFVHGTAHLNVSSSLMRYEESFIPNKENPNAYDDVSVFQGAYMDITYRRFNLYGGGYGEKTTCLNTDVYVTIPADRPGGANAPHGYTLKKFYDHQSFFDIAGGGYSGNVGYWAKKVGDNYIPVDTLRARNGSVSVDDYETYIGGTCRVVVDGYTYCRKLIGGGFYGSCRNTDTRFLCGSLRQVYGGSLLGYVHDQAKLTIGNRIEDFLRNDGTDTPADSAAAAAKAKELNKYIYITENVYGGNDVKGIIGTTKWTSFFGYHGLEETDGGPLFMTDVSDTEDKGVVFNIYGGVFMGDVYGAGNGHYRGYYVPEWVRYEDGPARMYRKVITSLRQDGDALHLKKADGVTDSLDVNGNPLYVKGRVYRSRPMVGCVNINIRGNSATDSITILGNFYGGGRECTIGQWRTLLPFEDPRRLTTGGHLHVNVGGHLHVKGNMYMGVHGGLYGEQQVLDPARHINLDRFNGTSTDTLLQLGEAAYGHWYFNRHTKRYEPGFPAPGDTDGNFDMTGEHMFRGHMKNIEMQGDVELTFYRDLYRDPATGVTDSTRRRRWIPAEIATDLYDADRITMNSFFLGGKCGSMTNNNVMRYCYTTNQAYDMYGMDVDSTHTHENFGAIYRVCMPRGVTIKNLLVMGAEDAVTTFYPYNEDFTQVVKTKPDGSDAAYYRFEGGMVTQSTFTFDYIAYNDYMQRKVSAIKADSVWNTVIKLPTGFYDGYDNPAASTNEYKHIWNSDTYTLIDGTVIHRKFYDEAIEGFNNVHVGTADGGISITDRRYALAVTRQTVDGETKEYAYIGAREYRRPDGRDNLTVSKLTASCMFDPQPGDGHSDPTYDDNYDLLYGGVIYGGCYNSGIIKGDVILNVGSNLLGNKVKPAEYDRWFKHLSTLDNYVGRVYGGGYGTNTRNDGDTYINLLRNVQAMNVFGGGMMGNVSGTANINCIGNDKSFVYGAIYGGGFRGSVGDHYYVLRADTTVRLDDISHLDEAGQAAYDLVVPHAATNVRLISGNVGRVYGGSCMGDLYGRARVELCDEVIEQLDHLEYDRFVEQTSVKDWGASRLIVGWVFGGNDIAGNIYHSTGSTIEDTYVLLHEEQYVDSTAVNGLQHAPREVKDTPGADNGFNGFPLVGNLFGGSNGSYGTHSADGRYAEGSVITVATGNKNNVIDIDLGKPAGGAEPYLVPHIDRTHIQINGGTVVNAYGGGDMATVKERTLIEVDYKQGNLEARAGFTDPFDLERIWNVCHISNDQQITEVMNDTIVKIDGQDVEGKVFTYQIFRLFGGNDHADMSIQPDWRLVRGNLGSIYSGANFGRMTYYNPDADPTQDQGKGLTLVIDAPRLHANAVYGGGRVGDVVPLLADQHTVAPDTEMFGAKLIIRDGVVDHVYGGNDVSGQVLRGSKVEIYGSISGDVYCAGNGNYLYKYDPSLPAGTPIQEAYDDAHGGRYFILPYKPGYGDNSSEASIANMHAAVRLMAINSYRPNVERCHLKISGRQRQAVDDNGDPVFDAGGQPVIENVRAFVYGSIYMGGNSATVFAGEKNGILDNVDFEIGDDVVINRIFMGSNGEQMISASMMRRTERINNIDLSKKNLADDADKARLLAANPEPNDLDCFNTALYPNLLDLYMRAVDVEGMPRNFELSKTHENAYIGDFFVGGNCGSMTTHRTIEFSFPHNIVFFGKIVGGSNNANVNYKGITHYGGLTRSLDKVWDDDKKDSVQLTDKVWIKVHSRFESKRLIYPNGHWWEASLVDDLQDGEGRLLERDHTDGKAYYVADDGTRTEYTGTTYLTRGRCNVYGGCFNSGTTRGNIRLDIYSDMLRYGIEGKGCHSDIVSYGADGALRELRTRLRTVISGINDKQWRTFAVVGGGFGSNTIVYGNIDVRMLPDTGDDHEVHGSGDKSFDIKPLIQHPSCSAIFGGSQEGLVIGNTTIELRDGTVLANVYGASEANYMYGSTEIMVGYPRHYTCKTNGQYFLDRADKHSRQRDALNYDGSEVVKHSVWYRVGDRIANNVYEQIKEYDRLHAADPGYTPQATEANFALCNFESPEQYGVKWDDIFITVGDPASRQARTPEAIRDTPYFGHGNIYGGGFISTGAHMSLAGQKTLKRFEGVNMPEALAGVENNNMYGGNSSIMIWDNPANADLSIDLATGRDDKGNRLRDHVTIGTARFMPVSLKAGDNKMGYYFYDPTAPDGRRFQHQPSGEFDPVADKDKLFFKVEADGGIYGGGRKVDCDGFRACDLAYYGYADYTPQQPKLINSFQRLDLLSATDCCLQLQGSNDFATNTVDATKYSMTRVGELRMNSSIDVTRDIDKGMPDGVNLGNTLHSKPRSRNFLAFFHSLKYLGAIHSNVSFDEARFHDENGRVVPDSSYFEKKDGIRDTFYNHSDRGNQALTRFKQRNVGTSPNMIGINNGYQLKIQGVRLTNNADNNVEIDNIYYGPAVGVMEVKLLTMAIGEGGGYVYALNHHEEDASATTPSFMQRLGNFVFPGAAFGAATATDAATMNYIIDDCFPVGMGYDYYMDPAKYHEHTGNVNTDQEIHYWYVNGQRYFFNATLTAVTAAYKTQGDTQRFHLDNSDNLIMLAGMTADSENMRVKSIKWTDEMGRENTYDLTRRDSLPDGTLGGIIPGYNLYITVDRNSNNELTPLSLDTEKNGAWVAEVTRALTFQQQVDEVDGQPVYRNDGIVNLGAANGKYGDKTVIDGSGTRRITNTPRLGVMLVDTCDNNAQQYFDSHLSKPATVQIVLAVDNPGDNSNATLPYEYTLNLSIVYLKGTNIHGHIVIENCALPGEVIYVNAYDVVNEGSDANMGVTNRRWVLYKTIERDDNGVVSIDKMVDVDITNTCKIDPATETRIAIPAYLWMNGWSLGYDVTMNGQTTRVWTDPTSEHPTLDVHNYHRMYAWDYSSYKDDAMQHPAFNDLQLVSGARVYLENETDLKYFFDYMHNRVQQPIFDTAADTLLQAHRGHIGSLYLPHDYDDIVQVDPQYAADVHFVLTTDIAINPTAMISDPDDEVGDPMGVMPNFENTFKFAGLFSGNGHTIDMNNCTQFMGENTMVRDDKGNPKVWGRIYNLGFHAQQPNVTVIGANHGRMLACFYYNDGLGTHPAEVGENPLDHRGQLIPQANLDDDDCDIQYCYQNANKGKKDHYGNSVYYADDQFYYGRVAYDLNVLYLNERYKRATSGTGNQNKLNKSYVYSYYGDGEYRFGPYDPRGIGTPTALRTSDFPNYGDHHGKGLIPSEVQATATGAIAAAYGKASSHHNWHHTIDDSREIYDGVYLPNYPKDFLFFGQKLDSEERYRQKYPDVLKADRSNRVYRASGFYGTQEDRGFHFNRDCVVRNPEITAIDFTGERTREREEWYKKYFGDVPGSATYEMGFFEWPIYVRDEGGNPVIVGGDTVKVQAGHHKQSVFFPPVLDLPTADVNKPTADATEMYLDGFSIIGNKTIQERDKITKNLLVYAAAKNPVFDLLRYTEDMLDASLIDAMTRGEEGGQDDSPAGVRREAGLPQPEEVPGVHSYGIRIQSDDQNSLVGHFIMGRPDGDRFHYEVNEGLFHLVDSQDFHAPIDFDVTRRAWYYRLPKTFSNGNSAWEGICLPFTANRVLATDYSGTDIPNPARSHGEVSHFYGFERTDTLGDNIRHEYWLRSMTGTHADGEKTILEFTRPLFSEAAADGTIVKAPYRCLRYDARGDIVEGDTLALDQATYHYSNTWFKSAYGGYENEGVYYQDLHTKQQYTEQGRDFHNYPFLTEAVPYIVSYPGKRYYEFSMSGEFYRDHHVKENDNVYPQIITYEYIVGSPDISGGASMFDAASHKHNKDMQGVLTIFATNDNAPHIVYADSGSGRMTLQGSYTYQPLDDDVQYTVDIEDASAAPEGKNPGTYFAPATEVAPFRVFLTVPNGMSIAHSRAWIGTRAADADKDLLPMEPAPEEETIDESVTALRVYVVDGKLHIDSPTDGMLPLHTISGLLFRNLRVHAGTTVYNDLPRGCYVVCRKKVLLR